MESASPFDSQRGCRKDSRKSRTAQDPNLRSRSTNVAYSFFVDIHYNAIKNGIMKAVPTVEPLSDPSAPEAINRSAIQFTNRADMAP